jgi:AcrR family transcriptional regulator
MGAKSHGGTGVLTGKLAQSAALKRGATRAMSAGERREALIDCAQELFFVAGYEPTTVNDIIDRAGISKGGFYHHFASKEDLLDAIVLRITEQIVLDARDVLSDPDLDALTRLNSFFASSVQWKAKSAPQLRVLSEALLKPENVLLFHRMVTAVEKILHPLLTRIVEQGVAEGIFNGPDPKIVADVFLSLMRGSREVMVRCVAAVDRGDLDEAVTQTQERIGQECMVMDRLLGVEDGSVKMIVDARVLRSFFEASAII